MANLRCRTAIASAAQDVKTLFAPGNRPRCVFKNVLLEKIERRRVPLVQVLPCGENSGHAMFAARPESVEGSHVKGFLVDVDQVPLLPPNHLGDTRVKMKMVS